MIDEELTSRNIPNSAVLRSINLWEDLHQDPTSSYPKKNKDL